MAFAFSAKNSCLWATIGDGLSLGFVSLVLEKVAFAHVSMYAWSPSYEIFLYRTYALKLVPCSTGV